MATPAHFLIALIGLLLGALALSASGGPRGGEALEALSREIARRRQTSQA